MSLLFLTYGLFKSIPVKHTVLATAWASPWCNIPFYGMWSITNGLLAKVLWAIYIFIVNFLLGCKRPSGSHWQRVCMYAYVCWSWAREIYLAITPVLSDPSCIWPLTEQPQLRQHISICSYICLLSVSLYVCVHMQICRWPHMWKQKKKVWNTCLSTHKYIYKWTATINW